MMHILPGLGRHLAAVAVLTLTLLTLPGATDDTVRAQEQRKLPPVPESWEKVGLRDYGRAPEVALPLADGSRELKLSELVAYGPVLLDFWATWCGPCRKAMPQYALLYEQYKDQGFSVLAVSEDSPQVTHKVIEFMEQMELPFPVVLDLEKKAGAAYYVRSLPTAYLIDRRGHVVSVEIGYAPGREKHLAEQIEVLLATDPADMPKAVETEQG